MRSSTPEALAQDSVVVTENASDFVAIGTQRLANEEPHVPGVLVHNADHHQRKAPAHHLARHLHQCAASNPNSYPGPHWA